MEKIKIKPLTIDQLKISIDRLTRFKNTETKYLRVFKDILTNNLIAPKFKKSELDELDYSILRELAEKIINFSLETLNIKPDGDLLINQRLYDYEKSGEGVCIIEWANIIEDILPDDYLKIELITKVF